MPLFKYEIIKKSKVEGDIYQRYAPEIKTLEKLGFDDLNFIREVSFPFSAVAFCFIYPYMWYKGEIFRVEWPLRYVLFNALMTSSQDGTYAQIFALGVKFHTHFINGTILVSTPTENTVIDKRHRFYKYGVGQSLTVMQLWESHCARVAEMEWEAKGIDHDLSLEKFEQICDKESQLELGGTPQSTTY